MSDVNNSSRKRSISISDNSDANLAANTDDGAEQGEPETENVEPATKIICIDDVSQNDRPNLKTETTDVINGLEKPQEPVEATPNAELEALRAENMELRLKLEEVSTNCNANIDVDGDEEDTPLITIKFHHKSIAETYQSRFQTYLRTAYPFKDLKHTTTDLEILISKVDFRKRKRKKSKSKSQDLFVVDTTPSLVTKEHSDLKYVSKYVVQTADEMLKSPEVKTGASVCWNCEKNHNLRDCPEPRDMEKIKNARNKMRAQQVTKNRYHLDEEQKYAHLKPGKISEQLLEALGVRAGELPPYIYRMRTVGYPPGWMEEAKIQHSNMSLFDIEGREDATSKKPEYGEIDPDKVVEYPGFNSPMDPGIRDDYRYHDCPPFSERCSKEAMLAYLKQMVAKQKDNLETCDMDLDTNTENSVETVGPPGCEDLEEDRLRQSPTLTDLEKKKLELLAELDNGSNNSNSDEVKMALDNVITEVITNEEKKDLEKSKIDDFDDKKIDNFEEKIDDFDPIKLEEETLNVTVENNSSDNVKLSVFGTPIIKGASPYNSLPHPEKFSKDISPVINFENLPNSTGKYERMTNVLQKVRIKMRNLNEKC